MGRRAKIHTRICLTLDFKPLMQHCFAFLSMSMGQPMPEVEFSLAGVEARMVADLWGWVSRSEPRAAPPTPPTFLLGAALMFLVVD